MSDSTKIEWTQAPGYKGRTWNPVVGCSRLSTGCENCFAERMAGRQVAMGTKHYRGTVKKVNRRAVWTGKINRAPDHIFYAPLRWKKPSMVFVDSMSDLFHENLLDWRPGVWSQEGFELLVDVFHTMLNAKQHLFQILTKRADIMYDMVPRVMLKLNQRRPLPNVWLGVSVENEEQSERISWLQRTPAAIHFLSLEPLLGPISIGRWLRSEADCKGHPKWRADQNCIYQREIDWVVLGGESGPGARPMHPDWARDIRDACLEAEVPYFFKQYGEWCPETVACSERTAKTALYIERDGSTRPAKTGARGNAVTVQRVGKRTAGRILDGIEWNQMPSTS